MTQEQIDSDQAGFMFDIMQGHENSHRLMGVPREGCPLCDIFKPQKLSIESANFYILDLSGETTPLKITK